MDGFELQTRDEQADGRIIGCRTINSGLPPPENLQIISVLVKKIPDFRHPFSSTTGL